MDQVKAFPVTLLASPEPLRAVRDLAHSWLNKPEARVEVHVWDVNAGARSFTQWQQKNGMPAKAGDPLDAIKFLNQAEGPTILIAINFHLAIKNARIVQGLLDGCRRWSRAFKRFVIVAPPGTSLPVELDRYIPVIDHELPDEAVLAMLVRSNAEANNIDITDDEIALMARLGRGLTTFEFVNALALSIARDKTISREVVADQKAQLVQKNAVLEWVRSKWTFANVGGLDRIKEFVSRIVHNELSRGVLCLGIPGVGKSMIAQALANEVGLPALQLQFSRVFGSLVGESEGKLHSALKVIEAMAPCVLVIDEIEKGLGGVGSSGRSDGGTTSRVGEMFLNWLNDRPVPGVFVMATCLSDETVLVSADGGLSVARDVWTRPDCVLWSVAPRGRAFAESPSWHTRRKAANGWRVNLSAAELECTDDHVFYRYQKGELREVQARNLRSGDLVAGPMALPHGIEDMDLDRAYMVGYTVGDGNLQQQSGCVDYSRIQWAEADRDHVDYLVSLSERVLGKKAGVTWRNTSNGAVVYVDSVDRVSELAQEFSELTQYTRARSVPDRICRATDEVIAAFLSGLFDADGSTYVKQSQIDFSTISGLLAHQVVLLLQRLGILATLCSYNKLPNRVYKVTVSGQQAALFADRVGFRMERKQVRARTIRSGERSGYTVDCVPVDWKAIYALDAPLQVLWGKNRPVTKQRERFREIVQALQAMGVDTSSIDWVLGYRWQKVKSSGALDGDLQVFDVHMPTEHNFVAAGVMAHNCNDISKLPPEFVRAERWDTIFFFDLPTQDERDEIAALYAQQFGVPLDPRPDVHGWTGAEITTAYRLAKMLDVDAEEAAGYVTPLYKTMREKMENLREWASGRTISASAVEVTITADETVRATF